MIYKREHILKDIIEHLSSNEPFSLVRVGDGDVKLLQSILERKDNSKKLAQQGIPNTEKAKDEVLNIYRISCNSANYITYFDVYHKTSEYYWPRNWSQKSFQKVKQWKEVYQNVGITNTNFCNPDISVFLFLDYETNLFSVLQQSNVCIITSYPKIKDIVSKRFKTSLITIPGRYSNHYSKYKEKALEIEKSKSDIFLVSGGVFGRYYSYTVKKCGKIAIDIGNVVDMWLFKKIVPRLQGLVTLNKDLTFSLTETSKKYERSV